MMNLHDNGHGPGKQGALPGELPIQLEGAALNILAAFLDYPPDALIVVDEAGTIVLINTQENGHELDEWQREKVQEMKQASWQLANLTEDLLDVTRIQAGQFALERRSTDLVALTRQVIKCLQATTDRHQPLFHTTAGRLWAMVDASRIEQVLSNLLSNTIKYSPEGGPVEVTLEEGAKAHEARFRIRDQGMGIPRAQQAHLFGRFVRGENVRTAGIRGTGLGLYLCRELIERHSGQISFESEEGVGSTFFFSLPCDFAHGIPKCTETI